VPRYFIHLQNRDDYHEDFERSELPDLDAAKWLAQTGAEIVANELTEGAPIVAVTLFIHAETGERLAAFPVSGAVGRPN
jgi:hypothetical protein